MYFQTIVNNASKSLGYLRRHGIDNPREMKQVLFALSLLMFVGTVGVTAYAATTDTPTEIKKDDDKRKKKKKANKKKAKASCSSESKGSSCCSAKKKAE